MSGSADRLEALFDKLGAADQASLLAFAEFLASRTSGAAAVPRSAPVVIPEPEDITRPDNESIVAGLKRLAKTYPMLDKSEMLSATSDIVATHLMQGTDPSEVIDQLEQIFSDHYSKLKSG